MCRNGNENRSKMKRVPCGMISELNQPIQMQTHTSHTNIKTSNRVCVSEKSVNAAWIKSTGKEEEEEEE